MVSACAGASWGRWKRSISTRRAAVRENAATGDAAALGRDAGRSAARGAPGRIAAEHDPGAAGMARPAADGLAGAQIDAIRLAARQHMAARHPARLARPGGGTLYWVVGDAFDVDVHPSFDAVRVRR